MLTLQNNRISLNPNKALNNPKSASPPSPITNQIDLMSVIPLQCSFTELADV